MLGIKVSVVDWEAAKASLMDIRRKVFIEEQHVPEDLEWDDIDAACLHILAQAGDRPIGCARLIQPDASPAASATAPLAASPPTATTIPSSTVANTPAKLGRMAVLAEYRGLGVGKTLMECAEKEAISRKFPAIQLSAQCHAYGFYVRQGYSAFSKPYDDASIPHVDMLKPLDSHNHTNTSVQWYELGRDDAVIQSSSLLEAKGYLDLFLSQTERALVLCMKHLDHPLSQYTSLLDKVKSLSKNKRYFKMYILLNHGLQPGNHPLLELRDRLPSFIEIRTAKTSIPNHWVFDGLGWLSFEDHDIRCCYGDRARVHRFMEKFKYWWDHATPCKEGQELHL